MFCPHSVIRVFHVVFPNNIDRLVSVAGTQYVSCEVRAELLYTRIIQKGSRFNYKDDERSTRALI